MSRSADPGNDIVHKEPGWKDLDLQQGDTLSYVMEYEDNERWWLAENDKVQV